MPDSLQIALAILLWTAPPALIGATIAGTLSPPIAGNGFGWDAFGITLVVLGFTLGIIAFVAVVVRADSPESRFLVREVHRIQLGAQGVQLLDRAGALLGDTTTGTLRLERANLGGGRSLFGAIQMSTRQVAVLVHPRDHIGAWPGLGAARAQVFVIDSGYFHELLARVA